MSEIGIYNARGIAINLILTGKLDDRFGIKVGAAVAEKSPIGAIAFDHPEIESVQQNSDVLGTELLDEFARVIGKERVAIKFLFHAVVIFKPDAVCGNDGHGIGNRVTLHGALPLAVGVERGIVGFRSDGRWI